MVAHAHHTKNHPPDLFDVFHTCCPADLGKTERQVRFREPSDRPPGRTLHDQPEQAKVVILRETSTASIHPQFIQRMLSLTAANAADSLVAIA